MTIPEERLPEFREIAERSNRHVAHILGKHPLPRDHATECGLCENQVIKQQLKFAEQKLHKLDRFAADWTTETDTPDAFVAQEVQAIIAKHGCCCCPVGCVKCNLGDCECYAHGDDHDTRCLGVTPSTPDGVAKHSGWSKTTICEIEKGHHAPRLATAEGYATAVGLNLGILGGDIDAKVLREVLIRHRLLNLKHEYCTCGWGGEEKDAAGLVHADHVIGVWQFELWRIADKCRTTAPSTNDTNGAPA